MLHINIASIWPLRHQILFYSIIFYNIKYSLDAFVFFFTKGDTGTPGIPGLDGGGGHPVSIYISKY